MRRRRLDTREERGQILVLGALLIPVLLGMAALAVDVGNYASDRRQLQNAADSMALAAGQELPDSGDAQAAAQTWATNNNVDISDFTVSVYGGSTAPRVTVQINRPHDFTFIRVLGINSHDVGARATAGKFSAGAATGVVPWSIEQTTVDSAASGDTVTVKYDSSGPAPGQGNFGAIRIDGSGSSDYESAVTYGSDYNICSQSTTNCSTANCPGAFPSPCAENAPECDGPECKPKTGNMTGPTRDAVDFRMGHTTGACDSFEDAFDEVTALKRLGDESERLAFAGAYAPRHHGGGGHATFTPTATRTATASPVPSNTPGPTNTPAATSTPAASPTPGATNTPAVATSTPAPTLTPSSTSGPGYTINPNCNPWSGGSCPPAPSSADCSRRIFLIPIIDEFGNGSSDDVTILGFALVYLEGYQGSCTGSSCDIEVRFVRAELTMNAFAGDYDPDSLNHFVRLTE